MAFRLVEPLEEFNFCINLTNKRNPRNTRPIAASVGDLHVTLNASERCYIPQI